MKFKEWLLAEKSANKDFSDYVQGGKIILYHFLKNSLKENEEIPKTIVLDPNRFGENSYTLNDSKVSSIPRVFFYVDLEDREKMVRGSLYAVTVSVKDIYDIIDDPDGIKEKLRSQGAFTIPTPTGPMTGYKPLNISNLLAEIIKAGYKGAYYKPGFAIVNWFYPIKATLIENLEPIKKPIMSR